MHDLRRAAAEIWRETGCGRQLRLIGGLAVREYVGRAARETADIDVVSMDAASWDAARGSVVNFRTFEAVSLHAEPHVVDVEGTPVSVVSVEELVVLKLVAHRAQDLIDLVLLSAMKPIEVVQVQRAAELDDIERSVAAGAVHARHLVQHGALAEAFREALGRELGDNERNAFARLLSDLERVGL